jgi:hypothetical protein
MRYDKCACGNSKMKKAKACDTCHRSSLRTTGFYAPRPYLGCWCQPPILAKSGRFIIRFVDRQGNGRSTSLARFLVNIYIGRKLPRSKQVDHIDGCCTNDSLNNLQILTSSENASKGGRDNRTVKVILGRCPICGVSIEKRGHTSYYPKTRIFTCSRSCASKVSHSKLSSKELRRRNRLKNATTSVLNAAIKGERITSVPKSLRVVLRTLERRGFSIGI